jgi:hypothetical protein
MQYDWFKLSATGVSGAAVTVDYERNGHHIDLAASGQPPYNQLTLPIFLNDQYYAKGDMVSLTVTYTGQFNTSAPLTIKFFKDDQSDPFTSAVGNGAATCSGSL